MTDSETVPSNFDPKGYTEARIEFLKDKELTARLISVQKKHGIQTGERFSDKGSHVVSVTFYPKTAFYIQDRLSDRSLGEARALSNEEYEATWGIRL